MKIILDETDLIQSALVAWHNGVQPTLSDFYISAHNIKSADEIVFVPKNSIPYVSNTQVLK